MFTTWHEYRHDCLGFLFHYKKTCNNYGHTEPRKATEITTKEYISDDNYKFFARSRWSNDERFIYVATLEPFVRPTTSTEVWMTFLRQCWCLILIEWCLITIRNTSATTTMISSDRYRYIRIFLVFLKLGLHFTRARNTFGLERIKSVRFLLLGEPYRILFEQGKFAFEIRTLLQTHHCLRIIT